MADTIQSAVDAYLKNLGVAPTAPSSPTPIDMSKYYQFTNVPSPTLQPTLGAVKPPSNQFGIDLGKYYNITGVPSPQITPEIKAPKLPESPMNVDLTGAFQFSGLPNLTLPTQFGTPGKANFDTSGLLNYTGTPPTLGLPTAFQSPAALNVNVPESIKMTGQAPTTQLPTSFQSPGATTFNINDLIKLIGTPPSVGIGVNALKPTAPTQMNASDIYRIINDLSLPKLQVGAQAPAKPVEMSINDILKVSGQLPGFQMPVGIQKPSNATEFNINDILKVTGQLPGFQMPVSVAKPSAPTQFNINDLIGLSGELPTAPIGVAPRVTNQIGWQDILSPSMGTENKMGLGIDPSVVGGQIGASDIFSQELQKLLSGGMNAALNVGVKGPASPLDVGQLFTPEALSLLQGGDKDMNLNVGVQGPSNGLGLNSIFSKELLDALSGGKNLGINVGAKATDQLGTSDLFSKQLLDLLGGTQNMGINVDPNAVDRLGIQDLLGFDPTKGIDVPLNFTGVGGSPLQLPQIGFDPAQLDRLEKIFGQGTAAKAVDAGLTPDDINSILAGKGYMTQSAFDKGLQDFKASFVPTPTTTTGPSAGNVFNPSTTVNVMGNTEPTRSNELPGSIEDLIKTMTKIAIDRQNLQFPIQQKLAGQMSPFGTRQVNDIVLPPIPSWNPYGGGQNLSFGDVPYSVINPFFQPTPTTTSNGTTAGGNTGASVGTDEGGATVIKPGGKPEPSGPSDYGGTPAAGPAGAPAGKPIVKGADIEVDLRSSVPVAQQIMEKATTRGLGPDDPITVWSEYGTSTTTLNKLKAELLGTGNPAVGY